MIRWPRVTSRFQQASTIRVRSSGIILQPVLQRRTVNPLATNGTNPIGINDKGQIVGVYTDSSGPHGFIYDNGTYTTIDDPSGGGTALLGINNAGEIVGTPSVVASSRAQSGVRWTPG